jgi:hypothetical protein
MSIPAWPATLPQVIWAEGYGESPADVLLRTSMDTGPAKVRRRSTAGVRPVTGKIKLISSELDIFLEFYNTTLLSGSLRFSWTEPRDNSIPVEMRFAELPEISAIDPGTYEVGMKLEILP